MREEADMFIRVLNPLLGDISVEFESRSVGKDREAVLD
jgi:hypothetical protein